MVDLAAARDAILEAIVTPDATRYGADIRNKGRAALTELLDALEAANKELATLEEAIASEYGTHVPRDKD